MSDHVRKQIRDEFVTALTGLTTTGANCFASRVRSLEDDALPGITIHTDQESIETDDESRIAREQIRTLTVSVVGHAKDAESDIDDTLDTIAKEVETAVFAAFPSSTVGRVDLAEILTEFDAGAEQIVGRITLEFLAGYITSDGQPTIADG